MLSAVYAVVVCRSPSVCLCVCVCVCVCVTLRYCIKTAKRRITQIMPHDRSATLVYIDKRVAWSLCHSRAICFFINVQFRVVKCTAVALPFATIPAAIVCSMCVLTARRYAKRGIYAVVVCPFVCLSVICVCVCVCHTPVL